MVYKVSSKGLLRIIVAKLDGKYSEVILRNKDKKVFVPIIADKQKKKLDLVFSVADDNMCLLKFEVHKTSDLQFIETVGTIAIDILEEMYQANS